MAVVTWPNLRSLRPASMSVELRDNVRVSRSEETGTTQVVERPGERLIWTLTWGAAYNNDMVLLQARLLELRGRVNTVQFWFFPKPTPKANIFGSLTLWQNVAPGAPSIRVSGYPAGAFPVAGDWIACSNQLMHVIGGVEVGGGVAELIVAPRPRKAMTAGLSVFYSYALGEVRLAPGSSSGIVIPWEPGVSPGFTASFEEVV